MNITILIYLPGSKTFEKLYKEKAFLNRQVWLFSGVDFKNKKLFPFKKSSSVFVPERIRVVYVSRSRVQTVGL